MANFGGDQQGASRWGQPPLQQGSQSWQGNNFNAQQQQPQQPPSLLGMPIQTPPAFRGNQMQNQTSNPASLGSSATMPLPMQNQGSQGLLSNPAMGNQGGQSGQGLSSSQGMNMPNNNGLLPMPAMQNKGQVQVAATGPVQTEGGIRSVASIMQNVNNGGQGLLPMPTPFSNNSGSFNNTNNNLNMSNTSTMPPAAKPGLLPMPSTIGTGSTNNLGTQNLQPQPLMSSSTPVHPPPSFVSPVGSQGLNKPALLPNPNMSQPAQALQTSSSTISEAVPVPPQIIAPPVPPPEPEVILPDMTDQEAVAELNETAFSEFYSEVKAIEKRDAVLTSKQQIERLTRPGATYFNLNPYDVLQIEPDVPLTAVKKRYRAMSILVHPDKNLDNKEQAQKCFEAVNKAYKTLENEEGLKRCKEIVEEAKTRTDDMIKQKKKGLKKEGKSQDIPEDTDEGYRHAVYVQTCKLFADLERLRQERAQKDAHERKRKAEEEILEEEKKAMDKEWQKNFEESRSGRVDSWRSFTKKKSKKSHTKGSFKPPKLKTEKRDF